MTRNYSVLSSEPDGLIIPGLVTKIHWIFLRGLWVRGRVVVTGLYLSRLTVLCTVHALCVATLVRAIVLQESFRAQLLYRPRVSPIFTGQRLSLDL